MGIYKILEENGMVVLSERDIVLVFCRDNLSRMESTLLESLTLSCMIAGGERSCLIHKGSSCQGVRGKAATIG